MRAKVKLQKMGETVDEVVVLEWTVGVGDTVAEEDTLMRVETDKIDVDVPSPVAGTVVELRVAVDDEVLKARRSSRAGRATWGARRYAALCRDPPAVRVRVQRLLPPCAQGLD